MNFLQYILAISFTLFAISSLIFSQQVFQFYRIHRLGSMEYNKYSENKLDISFIIMLVSLFIFIISIKNI